MLPLNVLFTRFTVTPLGCRVATLVFPEKVELVIVALDAVSANLIIEGDPPLPGVFELNVQRVMLKVPANKCTTLSAVLLLPEKMQSVIDPEPPSKTTPRPRLPEFPEKVQLVSVAEVPKDISPAPLAEAVLPLNVQLVSVTEAP